MTPSDRHCKHRTSIKQSTGLTINWRTVTNKDDTDVNNRVNRGNDSFWRSTFSLCDVCIVSMSKHINQTLVNLLNEMKKLTFFFHTLNTALSCIYKDV